MAIRMTNDREYNQILIRLDNQGEDIKELRKMIERLVRLEEHQQESRRGINYLSERVTTVERRLLALEHTTTSSKNNFGWLEKIIFLLIGALGWLAGHLIVTGVQLLSANV